MTRFGFRSARVAISAGLGLALVLGAAPAISLADEASSQPADAAVAAGEGQSEDGPVEFGGVRFDTLAAAFEAAKSGGTITLADDVTVTGASDADAVGLTGDVTLDLNGHTVYGNNNNIAIRAKSFEGGSLTITNGSIVAMQGTYCTVSAAEAELALEGVALSNVTSYGMSVKSFDDGVITLTNCTSTSTNGGAFAAAGGTINVMSGTYTQSDFYDHNSSIFAPSNGTGVINVYGGTFESANYGIYVFSSGGTLNYYGGDLKVTGEKPAIQADSANGATGSINVSGGSVSGKIGSVATGISVAISGGTFTDLDEDSISSYLVPGVTLSQSGEVVANEGTVFTVTKEGGAVVGRYATLSDAIAAVPDGGTVALTDDASGDGVAVNSGTNFTLDLGGHTYTVDGQTVGSPETETNGFQLLKDSTITIKNGAITSSKAKILIQNYSNLTLEGVALSGGEATDYVLSNNNGETHIGTGTTITATEGNVAFDVCRFLSYPAVSVTVDEGAGAITGIIELSDGGTGEGDFSLTINGGDLSAATLKYVGNTVADAITVKKDSSVEIAAPKGYRWVDNGNGPTLEEIGEEGQDNFKAIAQIGDVQYESLATAVTQAQPGQTVELLADVELGEALKPAAGITIDGKGMTISLKSEIANGPFIDVMSDGVTIKNATINTNGNAKHGVQFYSVEGGALESCTINGGSYTSVQVNNSTGVKVSGCTLNPAVSGEKKPYANIELSIGSSIANKVTPSLDVTGQAEPSNDLPFIYVDADTMARVLGKESGANLSNAQKQQAIDALNKSLSGARLSLTAGGTASGEKPVTPPAQTGKRVNVAEAEGGKVSVTPTRAEKGETVTITVTPDEGKMVGKVTVTGEDGKELSVKAGEKDGTWTFEMPGGEVTVSVTFTCDGGELCPSHHLSDVEVGTWYHGAVDWAVETGLMSGMGDGTFAPSERLSRAQLAALLWNRAGHPVADASAADRFVDVDSSAFYAGALDWCVETGAFMGLDDTHFGPADDITREQLAVVLWRMADEPASDQDLSDYPDGSDVSAFADTAVRWAVETGVLSGQGDGSLDPQGAVDRAQAAAIFQRLAE